MKTYLFDFSKVLLFSKDPNYQGDLNPRYKEVKDSPQFSFFEHFVLNQELLEHLANNVKDAHFCIFTSGSIQNASELEGKLTIFSCIFSAEELGLNKKESSAFVEISRLLGKSPQEVIFIDDSMDNIKAATEAGLTAIQYQNNQQIMEYLK